MGVIAKLWARSHRGKIVHRWWLGAWWHARRINRIRVPSGEAPREPYVCHWSDDPYREGPKHWHVGRKGAQ